MFLRIIVILFFSLYIGTSYAQQILKAKVLENKTRITLSGIDVRNLNNKQHTVTDKDGRFSIPAKINDLLVLTAYTYENDTVLVTDLKPREIFLEPKGITLQEVKVSTLQMNLGTLVDPTLHNQTITYQKDANGYSKGGVAFNIFSNKSEENKRKKLEKIQNDDKVYQDIDKTFSPENLAKYLPLKHDELVGFKTRYVPSVKTYTSKQFNLVIYLDSCYKEFQKLPPEKKVADKLYTSPIPPH